MVLMNAGVEKLVPQDETASWWMNVFCRIIVVACISPSRHLQGLP
ncbi:unnamed protein product [Lathyrus sativus]|nr:unnamed protein product [Lathyrus sativus]